MRKGLGEPSRREALFGGEGEVLVWDLLGRTRLAPFTAVLVCELAPGGRVGAHLQQAYPEIVVVFEGEGIAEIEGVPRAIAAGSLVALPRGATLALTNTSGSAPLRYLIVKAEEPGEERG